MKENHTGGQETREEEHVNDSKTMREDKIVEKQMRLKRERKREKNEGSKGKEGALVYCCVTPTQTTLEIFCGC